VIAVCVGSLILLAYTYFGYPLVIGVLARAFPFARRRGRPGTAQGERDRYQPRISILLPVYNGAGFLERKLQSLLDQDYPPEKIEVLVYSDGSTDDTDAVAARFSEHAGPQSRVKLIKGDGRHGKPHALNHISAIATGELLVLNDVRQPFNRGAVTALVEMMEDPSVGCASGNLVLEGGAASGLYWRYENWIRRQESRFRSVVGMSGAIAIMRRADFERLDQDLILDDVWIPMRLRLRGQRVLFCEEAQAYDSAFEDQQEFRRKVRTLAGNYQLFARMPALLSPLSNPSWFETISHKVMRLLAPWFMGSLLISSAALAFGSSGLLALSAGILLALQLGFYLGALVGRRAGRLAGVARTFMVLNLAAVVGLGRYLSGRQRVTW
jgi:cellulose synthase/poly-beta-1,6-N-acetylglucosamine synthase-like glycosyltransferase